MKIRKILRIGAAPVLLILLAACGGTAQQQADTTQPASVQSPPEPVQTAQNSPPPTQQQAAQQPAQIPAEPQAGQPAPKRTAPRPAARPATPPASSAASMPSQPVTAPEPKKVNMMTVPAGTVLSLSLDAAVGSAISHVGDVFTATVTQPVSVGGVDLIPAGSKVQGTITEAVAAKRGAGNAKLAMSFNVLKFEEGFQTNIVGSFQETTASKKKRNAAVIGGSAAGGALLGRIMGKNTKGAVIGSIIGGGIGTAVVMGKEGEQANLPADSPFEIKLEEAVQVPHAPAGS